MPDFLWFSILLTQNGFQKRKIKEKKLFKLQDFSEYVREILCYPIPLGNVFTLCMSDKPITPTNGSHNKVKPSLSEFFPFLKILVMSRAVIKTKMVRKWAKSQSSKLIADMLLSCFSQKFVLCMFTCQNSTYFYTKNIKLFLRLRMNIQTHCILEY